MKAFKSFEEFYPFYLSQHRSTINRYLHFFGTLLGLLNLFYSFFISSILQILLTPILGYGFAWFGHFFFEKNKPATFKHPFYSLLGDFIMFKDILTINIDNKFQEFGIEKKP